MGNSSTKEQRPHLSPSQSHAGAVRHPRSYSASSGAGIASQSHPTDTVAQLPHLSRHGRGNRSDLSFLGIGSNSDRETAGLETRRETKQDREARKAEKERQAREKERERSMREESVDGGYLVTQGVYTGPEDYNKAVVRQLMIERRLAPFFKGLNDYSSTWRDDQLVAAVRGRPIPTEVVSGASSSISTAPSGAQGPDTNLKNVTVAISSRSQSFNSESSPTLPPSHPAFLSSSSNLSNGQPVSSASSSLFRPRSKTLASLTTLSKNNSHGELTPQEVHIPTSPTLGGRPIEAVLYKDASECPICFLYYPAYLNRTRCCDQPICSECFVQIKRPDPHPPEHTDLGSGPSGPSLGVNGEIAESLISEPAACPFCVQPELGVTYEPPPFRTGLVYANHPSSHPLANATSAMSSSSSLSSFSGAGNGSFFAPSTAFRRRTTSISANSPGVITTDRIRPDWAQKLANARAHAARRSAAATALHTAAYLMGGVSGSEGRSFAGFGRRNRYTRGSGADGPLFTTRTLLSQRGTETDYLGTSPNRDGSSPAREGSAEPNESYGEQTLGLGRRTRLDDLEDMMMMEAIRLSLLSEEERKKKEEKEAKKEAKKKGKESKRSGKAPKTQLNVSTDSDNAPGLCESLTSGSPLYPDETGPSSRGKGVERRVVTSPSSETTAAQEMTATANLRPRSLSHQVSSSSSRATSFVDSAAGSVRNGFHGSTSSFEASSSGGALKVGGTKAEDVTRTSTPPIGGSGTESMFNFRSLAAMIGHDDDKLEESRQGEHVERSSAEKVQAPSTEGTSGSSLVVNNRE